MFSFHRLYFGSEPYSSPDLTSIVILFLLVLSDVDILISIIFLQTKCKTEKKTFPLPKRQPSHFQKLATNETLQRQTYLMEDLFLEGIKSLPPREWKTSLLINTVASKVLNENTRRQA